MTTGALIFAFNNEHIDYLAMANWSAKNIRRHLDLPVAVVTDKPVPADYIFEKVIYTRVSGTDTRHFRDINQKVTWYNGNRMDVYNLTPWDQTLLLDADYVVASNSLLTILNTQEDFLCFKNAYDITGVDNFNSYNNFGRYNTPMYWATVVSFCKSKKSKMIFDMMSLIKNNWDHYRNLYAIGKSTYRNDFALSIALNTVNGHNPVCNSIPWQLASVSHDHRISQCDQDLYRVDYVDSNNRYRYITISQDFHAMGKKHLGDIVANNT